MRKILFILTLFIPLLAQAQKDFVSSGGEANGTTGTISYSIGQPFYAASITEQGSNSPGVQQTFKISELPAETNLLVNLQMAVYPNPTTHLITLNIEHSELSGLTYSLFGMSGQILRTGAIKEKKTELSMEEFGAAIYLLKVFRNSTLIKTFQIIKNN